MTLSALFGYSLLATVAFGLVWVAVRIFWPRKVTELDQHEMLTADWEKRS